jgi:anthranilate synthase component 1
MHAEIIKHNIRHQPDPLQLFQQVCGPDFATSFLLESADLTTKTSIQSLIGVRTAAILRIRGQRATLIASTPNGQSLVSWIELEFSDLFDGKSFNFPRPDTSSNEEERLKGSSPLHLLRKLITRIPIVGGDQLLAAGYFSYDLIDIYEELPPPRNDELGAPDALFIIPESLVILNHRSGEGEIKGFLFNPDRREDLLNHLCRLRNKVEKVSSLPFELNPAPEVACTVDWSDEDYAAQVEHLKKRIISGDVFQIVPSRTFKAHCNDPVQAYARLRALNPSPYMFFINDGDLTVFGASPETAVKVEMPERLISIRPIAGTAPRGLTPDGFIDQDLDNRNQAELVRHEKELAEHMMLIDLARNDVARVSDPGTRVTSEILTVEKYAFVMHLVSNVTGRLKQGLDALHAYTASMNMGTLVGSPKVMAAKILRETEPTKRGPYGGAVGYLTSDGTMNTAIIIRSAVVKEGTAHVRAGAGVVYDSIPENEALETRRKAQAVLQALGVKS